MPFPAYRNWIILALSLVMILSLIPSCSVPPNPVDNPANPLPTSGSTAPAPVQTDVHGTPTSSPSSTTSPVPQLPRLFLADDLPQPFRAGLRLPSQVKLVSVEADASLRIAILPEENEAESELAAYWIYALVAPFPTPLDQVSKKDLEKIWKGISSGALGKAPLLLNPQTHLALEAWLGPPDPKSVRVIPAAELLERAWEVQPSWAIIPFEQIEPRWKVLRIDGQSPLNNQFQAEKYPLAVRITLQADPGILEQLSQPFSLPTNRDPQKLTVLAMTGVTALSRHIGEVMENKGITYPARDIGDWLSSADLTHISNEVSFYQDCPKPGPLRADMRFCSSPKYIDLLAAVGADIIELTGNHNLDWGFEPYFYTLDLYNQRGWKTFGGGSTLEEARKPLTIEHNSNKLVFLGCSPAGPEAVRATADEPGSAPCDFEKLKAQITGLRSKGYLPIVTLQAVETDVYLPPPAQAAPDFRRLASAGAVIVSGSQAHVPQTMTFVGNSFVHYGLGNLFFDQMKPPESRQAFIDRHTFYAGKYLGVELLTTMLEEYARPRLMTAAERETFLEKIFSLSDWNGQ